MAEGNKLRLNKVLRELNISLDRAVEHLAKSGHEIEARPTTKISDKEYQILFDGFKTDKSKKVASKEVSEEKRKEKEAIRQQVEEEQEKKRLEDEAKKQEVLKAKAKKLEFKTVGKIDVKTGKPVEDKKEPVKKEAPKVVVETPEKKVPVQETKKEEVKTPEKKVEKKAAPVKVERTKPVKAKFKIVKEAPKKVEVKPIEKVVGTKKEEVKAEKVAEVTPETAEKIKTQYKKLDGPKITGQKIDLKQFERPKKKKPDAKSDGDKKKRKRISKPGTPKTGGNTARPAQNRGGNRGGNNRPGFRGRGAQRPAVKKEEPTEAEVQKQVRETLEKLQGKSKKGKGTICP